MKRGGNTDRRTAPGAPVLTFTDESSFDELSPSVRMERFPTEDLLFYGSYSEGFKSGIFLSGQTSPVLEPETVDAYELGMKGTLLDRRLQLNAAAFLYDYTDLQQGCSVPAGTSGFALVYENTASAEINGAETEFSWLPSDNLRIDGSVTYLDATFADYVTTDPFDTVFQQLALIPPDVDLSQGAGGTQRMPRLIGVAQTLELILGARPVDVERCVELGFVDSILEEGEFSKAALDYARQLPAAGHLPRRSRCMPVDSATGMYEYREVFGPMHWEPAELLVRLVEENKSLEEWTAEGEARV